MISNHRCFRIWVLKYQYRHLGFDYCCCLSFIFWSCWLTPFQGKDRSLLIFWFSAGVTVWVDWREELKKQLLNFMYFLQRLMNLWLLFILVLILLKFNLTYLRHLESNCLHILNLLRNIWLNLAQMCQTMTLEVNLFMIHHIMNDLKLIL